MLTNDTAALVERLRSVDISWSETGELCAEAAATITELRAENALLTKWKPIETAPDDGWFLAAIEVRHKSGSHWWEYHVVHTDCEQGWSISDYSHWVAVPDAPYPLNEARATLGDAT